MNKFGTLKTKILQKLTDAYASGNKSEIKNILKLIKENKEFLNMYLFYEEMENKYIDDKESAEIFLEEITPLLKKHKHGISEFTKELDKKIGDVPITENTLYTYMDTLLEADTLKNVHNKIVAKKKLIEHLTTKKELVESENVQVIQNEALLHTVLASNFNALYGTTLTEEEQKQFVQIMSMTNDELSNKFGTLKEEVTEKMTTMLKEDNNKELVDKLSTALSEAKQMKPTRYNYYKLEQLKNGL